MITIKQLLEYGKRCYPDYVNTKYVRITRIYKITPNVYKILTYTRIPPGAEKEYPRGHAEQHMIHLKDKSNNNFTNLNSHIEVGCNCGRFKYVWEYALAKHGAAMIMQSNGQPAKETNPSNYPGCCKHILCGLQRISTEIHQNKIKEEQEQKRKQRQEEIKKRQENQKNNQKK